MITDWAGIVWKRMPKRLRRLAVVLTQQRFTVSGAVVITDRDGRILLLDHYIRPRSGWGLPGGFISKNEQPEAGVRREVHEETGLKVTEVRLLNVCITGAHCEIVFAANAEGEPTINTREIRGFGWFGGSDLPSDIDPEQKRRIGELLRRSFEKSEMAD